MDAISAIYQSLRDQALCLDTIFDVEHAKRGMMFDDVATNQNLALGLADMRYNPRAFFAILEYRLRR